MNSTREWEVTQQMLLGDFSYTKDFNPNHDNLGRFSSGSSASVHSNRRRGRTIEGAQKPQLKERYSSTETAIVDAESKIRDLEYEVGVIVSPYGEVLHNVTQGNTISVNFADDDNHIEIPRDCSITHNHPDADTFSTDDVKNALYSECKSFRACNPYGAFVLTREYDLDDNVPSHYRDFYNDLYREYKRYYNKTIKPFVSVLSDEDATKMFAKLSANYIDSWLNQNATHYGWSYREEWL